MTAKTPHPAVGQQFGRLTVTGEPLLRGRSYYVPTRCSCGVEKLIMKQNLTKGASRSCGCLNRAAVQQRCRKHPLGSQKTYNVWFAMVRRCTNPEDESYHNYGGRGITVDPRWLDFKNFWEDMGPAPKGLTLERRKNGEGYSKSNCVWATRSENLFNKRTTIWYEYEGKLRHLGEISQMTGISYRNLYRRLRWKGMTMEEAVKPVKFKSPNGQAVWNKPTPPLKRKTT